MVRRDLRLYQLLATPTFKSVDNPCTPGPSNPGAAGGITMSDNPNAPKYWFGLNWGFSAPLLRLRQEFVTCVVCLAGNEGMVHKNYLGLITNPGLLSWRHCVRVCKVGT